MEHRNTRLGSYHRGELVADYLGGKPVAVIARELKVSRTTVYKWLNRYEKEGEEGLKQRSSRPHFSPRRVVTEIEEQVLADRALTGHGPDRIALALKLPASTVYAILRRYGQNCKPRLPRAPVVRYEHPSSGDLVHIDLKEIPGLGCGGKQFQFSAEDDHSRSVFAEILERATTVAVTEAFERAEACFRAQGVRIRRVLTDNGMQFTMAYTPHPERSTKFQKALARHGIKHSRTKPYSPQTNGKVERFHRTVDDELYKTVRFTSNADRAQKLKSWVRYYNNDRYHLGIKGLTPNQRLHQSLAANECQQCA
jgi:transposase InsO family protein